MASDPPFWFFQLFDVTVLGYEPPATARMRFSANAALPPSKTAAHTTTLGLEAHGVVRVSDTASLTAIGPGHGGGIATLS